MKSYIAIQSGGFYSDACVRHGYMNPSDCAVIEYGQFVKFMNEGEATRPLFVSPEYAVCIQTAKELNESATEIQLQQQLQEG